MKRLLRRRILRRRAYDGFVITAGLAAVGLVFTGLLYVGTHVPCGWFKYESAAKVPARCLKQFTS